MHTDRDVRVSFNARYDYLLSYRVRVLPENFYLSVRTIIFRDFGAFLFLLLLLRLYFFCSLHVRKEGHRCYDESIAKTRIEIRFGSKFNIFETHIRAKTMA